MLLSKRRIGCTPRPTSRGFTLLEVLVALVIIGVSLAAAMRGALSLTGTAEQTRNKQLATLAAENRLLELRLGRTSLELGESTLDCDIGGLPLSCQQIIKPTPNPFFRRVELHVKRPATDGQGFASEQNQLAEMMTVLPTNQ